MERYLGEGDGTIALRLVSGNRMTGHISAGLWPSAESPINLFAGGEVRIYLEYDGENLTGAIFRFKEQPTIVQLPWEQTP